MRLPLIFLVILCFGLTESLQPAQARMASYTPSDDGSPLEYKKGLLSYYDYLLITETDLAIALVSVKEIPRGEWTNGNPPTPTLKILKLMRGGEHPWNLNAVWHPFPYDAGWAGDQAGQIKESWKNSPMAAPKLKSQWYVAGRMEEGVFHVSPVLRYKSDKALYEVLGPMVNKSLKNLKSGDVKVIEVDAARAQRLAAWQERLKKGNVKALTSKSDMVFVADVKDMDPLNRMVTFTVREVLKSPEGIAAPESIELPGITTLNYAALYDHSKLKLGEKQNLVIYTQYNGIPHMGSGPNRSFILTDSDYGIQLVPVTESSTLN